MADVVVFHHVLGLTPGIVEFAETLRRHGHAVKTPDLFEGRTFERLTDGVAHAEEIGVAEIIERGARAVEALPQGLVYAGFSLGVLPAQFLAQTRPGARGALLFHSCVAVSEFGERWPEDVPVQVHAMEHDPYFVEEGDIQAADALVESTEIAELLLYPGEEHLFADSSLPSYDADAALMLTREVLAFLRKVDGG